ncbi:Far upstream element-binding protein 1 [Nymphon striatum]|nr:Far upstream element-binding protein 1 [Nymphon striatum]
MSDYNSVAPPSTISNNVDPNSAFADALQRAREIAAKINTPSGESTTNGTAVGQKRPLEVENSNMDYPAYGAQLAAMQRYVDDQNDDKFKEPPITGGAPNSVATEEYKVPDKMVGLIIGRGGEQITRLQADSGCKVQMAADSGGLPDRSCSLTGTRAAIEKAKEMIEMIINRGAPVAPPGGMEPPSGTGVAMNEMTIPAGKVGLVIGKGGEMIKNLQDRAGVKMVMIQEGPQVTGQDKPLRITGDPQKCEYAKQLVMDLITEKELEGQQGGRPGFRNQYQNEYGSQNQNRNEIGVPRPAVGVVIGKSGDMIKKIQTDTGARVQFQQGKDEGPGDRICMVSGTPEQVHHATNFIHELINSVMKDQGMRGPGRGGGPAGRGGGGGGFDRRGPGSLGPNCQETTYPVPAGKCGIVIGKGGETIRAINSQSGAHVELDRNQPQNPYEKNFIIRGTPEQIHQAQELIAEKIGVAPPSGSNHPPTSYPVPSQQEPPHSQPYVAPQGWSNAYQQWNQPAAAPADPVFVRKGKQTADVNAAWAAAYCAQYYGTMTQDQAATNLIQQSTQQPGLQPQPTQPIVQMTPVGQASTTQANGTAAAAAAATNSATAAPGTAQQPDYSQAWIEYYRSLGMFREAEMVEQQRPQGGQPQPQQPVVQPTQQTQYQAQAPAASVAPQAQQTQSAQQQYQYGQYAAAQPQQAQQFSGQQAAAGYGYNYPGYTAPQQ